MQGSVLRLGLEIRLVLWDFFEWLFSDCLTFLILANNGVSFSFFYHWWLFCLLIRVQFSSIRTLSCVHLFGTPWTAAHKTSLSITNSQSLLRLMSIQSVMPSNISTSVVPFSSCLQPFPASGSFQWVSSSDQVAKVLEFQLQHQSFQWIFRTDFL